MTRRTASTRYAGLTTGLVVAALVLGLNAIHALSSVDFATVDARFSIRGGQPPDNIVIVGIDANTYDGLPAGTANPPPRRFDARVIANLVRAGAKVIAVDLQFTAQTDPTDDNALIREVRAAGNVVLATTDVGPRGTTDIFGGAAGLAYSRATPGEAQFPLDSDGVIRRMSPEILGLRTFSMVVAQRYVGHPIAFPGGATATAPIDFMGPANAVPSIDFASAYRGDFNAAAVRGKIVIVGFTDPLYQDVHATATSPLMSGAEIQANAVQTALEGFPLGDAPGWVNAVLVIGLSLAAPLFAWRLSVAVVIALTAAAIALLAVVVQLAFDAGTIVGFVYPALGGLLSAGGTFAVQGRVLARLRAKPPVEDFFVCYRRGQSELAANLLKEALERRSGERKVFMDVDAIDLGERWPIRIERAIAKCTAMFVLIGPAWLDARTPDGKRRLDDPGDWVRREVETGLGLPQVAIVPVLHDGAAPPSPGQLPESLAALAECQAVAMSGLRMDEWVQQLIDSIDSGRRRQFSDEPVR